MNHWLLKTEPSTYSWSDLVRDGGTFWNGVHNYGARNNLRSMKVGDLAFIYHSGEEKAVVGIVRITREAYPDKEDPVWSWVDLVPEKALARPVTLAEIKAHPALSKMAVVKQGRLSVGPVSEEEWKAVLAIR
jgi:predicted RNA-binding protein with PUA-like domain